MALQWPKKTDLCMIQDSNTFNQDKWWQH
jgi:hypothetical protein